MTVILSYGALKNENIEFREKISFLQKILKDQFIVQTIDQEKNKMFEEMQNWTIKLKNQLQNLKISVPQLKSVCTHVSKYSLIRC